MLFLPALFVVAGQAENLVVDTPSTPMAISASRSGKVLATLLPDGDVRLWRFDNPRKVGRLTARLLRFGTSDWVAWTPDGAVAGTKQGLGHLYRMRNGKVDRLSQQVQPEKVAAALTG